VAPVSIPSELVQSLSREDFEGTSGEFSTAESFSFHERRAALFAFLGIEYRPKHWSLSATFGACESHFGSSPLPSVVLFSCQVAQRYASYVRTRTPQAWSFVQCAGKTLRASSDSMPGVRLRARLLPDAEGVTSTNAIRNGFRPQIPRRFSSSPWSFPSGCIL